MELSAVNALGSPASRWWRVKQLCEDRWFLPSLVLSVITACVLVLSLIYIETDSKISINPIGDFDVVADPPTKGFEYKSISLLAKNNAENKIVWLSYVKDITNVCSSGFVEIVARLFDTSKAKLIIGKGAGSYSVVDATIRDSDCTKIAQTPGNYDNVYAAFDIDGIRSLKTAAKSLWLVNAGFELGTGRNIQDIPETAVGDPNGHSDSSRFAPLPGTLDRALEPLTISSIPFWSSYLHDWDLSYLNPSKGAPAASLFTSGLDKERHAIPSAIDVRIPPSSLAAGISLSSLTTAPSNAGVLAGPVSTEFLITGRDGRTLTGKDFNEALVLSAAAQDQYKSLFVQSLENDRSTRLIGGSNLEMAREVQTIKVPATP